MTGEIALFEQILKEHFGDLPGELRSVHDARPSKQLRGRCSVERGPNWLAVAVAWITSLPRTAKEIPLTVTIECAAEVEIWTRDFDGHRMRSRLWRNDGLLAEQLGPITFAFELNVERQRLLWRVASVRFLGLRLPLGWFSGTSATEELIDGRYTFDVNASLPLVGLLVRYRGWLSEVTS